jgi:hypothetical protein
LGHDDETGVMKALSRFLRRLLCKHALRASKSWPGMQVCMKCGARLRGGD